MSNNYFMQKVNLFLSQEGYKSGIRFPSVTSFRATPVSLSQLNAYTGSKDAEMARAIYSEEGNSEAYKQVKKYCPCVQLFSCQFPSKDLPRGNIQALQKQTGFFSIDVDHFNGSIDKWKSLSGCIGWGRSVSGDGYFFIFRTNFRFISGLQFSEWIAGEVMPLFDGYADPACKDCHRLRFLGADAINWTGAESVIDDIVQAPLTNYDSEIIANNYKRFTHFDFRKRQLQELSFLNSNDEKHRRLYTLALWIAEDIKKGLYELTEAEFLEAAEVVWNEPLNSYELNSIHNAFAKSGVNL